MNIDWQIISVLARGMVVLVVLVWLCRNWSKPTPVGFAGYWLHMTPFLLMIFLMGFYVPMLWGFLTCFMAVFGPISFVTRHSQPTLRPLHLPEAICRVHCRIGYVNGPRRRIKGELLPAH